MSVKQRSIARTRSRRMYPGSAGHRLLSVPAGIRGRSCRHLAFAGSRMLRDLLAPKAWRLAAAFRNTDEADKAPTPRSQSQATKCFRTVGARCRSRAHIRWSLAISYAPWRAALSTSRRSSVIADRLQRRTASSSRYKKRRHATASPIFTAPIEAVSSPASRSPSIPIDNAFAISMDGKSSWRENISIEWLWWLVKYAEGVSLSLRDGLRSARRSLATLLFTTPRTVKP